MEFNVWRFATFLVSTNDISTQETVATDGDSFAPIRREQEMICLITQAGTNQASNANRREQFGCKNDLIQLLV
jgi:hypothetical protein